MTQTLAEAVRQAREHADLSQLDLANRAGLSEADIVDIEMGRREIDTRLRYRLATALGRKVRHLFPDNEDGATASDPVRKADDRVPARPSPRGGD